MKIDSSDLETFLQQMRSYFLGANGDPKYVLEAPLRSELYSVDQMAQHSRALAKSHTLTLSKKRLADRLLLRLADNERVLLEVRNLLTASVQENNLITPAGEWLLDNFYLIEEQVRTAKKHLPKEYSEGLPQLSSGASSGLPRVYDIALEIISHSDGRIDLESLENFVHAYQTVHNFMLGELWAVPIMLRLAIIENLRRVCASIAIDRVNRSLADHWAKRMIATAENDPKSLILDIADMARSAPPMERAFVAELLRQLRGKGPSLTQPLNWMEERLAENGQTSNELVQIENQKQAADQVSVSNSIGSLRLLGSMDWREFVEANSIVEHILREDSVYASMDFSTRDHYRHVVEQIAKSSELPESEVARIAVDLAKENGRKMGSEHRSSHIGFFLIDAGKPLTERQAKMRLPFTERFRRAFARFPLFWYLGSIMTITLAVSSAIVYRSYADGDHIWLVIALGILSVTCASQLGVTLVNFFTNLVVRPGLLPRMDFSKGISNDARTLVVVPTMLTTAFDIDELVEALEVRFLANKDDNLRFALLTDFVDAPLETMPEDTPLLELTIQKIEDLNQKYSRKKNDIFYLLHRPRKWNGNERVWMGYERKRGKLADLNRLLRGNEENRFSQIIGDTGIFSQIKYVITLDSDTQLPREAAWKIIATMAHPLNRAVYNESKGIVSEGYGILQPRVSISMPGPESSVYARMNGNEPGMDPYTRVTSDVYQDLFNEGSFIGKGIYEVDIFEKILGGKFPENRILSHDLLEGCFVRSGLISDVQLYEKHPVRYDTDMKRRHRWIRGDWQIAAWCAPFAPGGDGRWHRNPLSALSRWKIMDNIRRSVVPIAFTLFVLMGWTAENFSSFWTLSITVIIILPLVVSSLWDMLRKPKDLILSHHLLVSGRSAGNSAVVTLFIIICLPYEAYISVDVILKTAWRMLITHRGLLKWTTFSKLNRKKSQSLWQAYLSMWIEPLLAIGTFAYLFLFAQGTIRVAAPILSLWLFAPLITWWVSRPLAKQVAQLSKTGAEFLQKLARKTWAYFENFVTASENWLPPDNYQEVPIEAIAHRTSPTNMGVSLLSNLAAYDFGYLGMGEFAQRTAGAIDTMKALQKYNGHFFNWYDTLSMEPSVPRYISTVDSGNLAGHLLTLRQGILAMPDQKIIGLQIWKGIKDTWEVLEEKFDRKNLAFIIDFRVILGSILQTVPADLSDTLHRLEKLQSSYLLVHNNLEAKPDSDIQWWKNAFASQIKKLIEDLKIFAPWVSADDAPGKFKALLTIDGIPTLTELARICASIDTEISQALNQDNTVTEKEWLNKFRVSLTTAATCVNQRIALLERLSADCADMVEMEYGFLYNNSKHLLAIGYNVDEHRPDSSFYDLLASEARLSTFVGIAQGKLPQESWFSLGRLLTNAGGRPILLSWSGSMFEYLMPLLVMPSYENTLLNQTDEAAVARQIEYGKQRGVPWGVSESSYNLTDAASNYQYRAFGVPGLGLKRGLGEDLVIAPYASALALMVMPEQAYENLLSMAKQGFEGKFGFYEAIDYTPSRLQRGQSKSIVQSYMAHHQGMSFLSMAYLLLDQPMQKRFEAEPQFQATLLLLQERIPKATSFFAHTTNIAEVISTTIEAQARVIHTPSTGIPEVQLLSNGKYHVMVTNSGAGYSRWKDISVTRWREDVTRDNWGTFCYIRDLDTGAFWSTFFQPTRQKIDGFEAVFSQGRADFKGSVNKLEFHTEIVVSPEDDIEMRRLNITNRSGKSRTIDITSYTEVVIAPAAADAAHQAFSNLFVQTEILPNSNAIMCTRRPKSVDEKQPYMFHLMNDHSKAIKEITYETDRMAFIGRGHTVANPQAMEKGGKLGGAQGSVLDPIAAIRYKITIEPDETVTLDMIIGIGETREICQALIDKYQDRHHKDRVFELAWTHSQVVLRQINATESDAQLYTRLANSVLFINPALRAEQSILIKNHKGQSGLWPYSISGDLPIVLLKVEEQTDIELVKQLIQAHTFWRLKGLAVDLVIWNDSHDGYRQILHNDISGLIAPQVADRPGGIFVRGSDQISTDDRILFQTTARAIITTGGGTLADHVNRKAFPRTMIPALVPAQSYIPATSSIELPDDLLFYNELGGFSPDGREYVMRITRSDMTPAPWVNVIANPNFGTVISECGQSYTWSENAHEMRLTPWENDPVSDASGEAFYLRDEDTGHYWSATSLPCGGSSAYITRHGFGYSVFEHEESGIHTEMWVYVDMEAAVKFTNIKIKNNSGRPRRITVTGYAELVLGDLKPKTAMYIVTESDPETGALFARNPYNTEMSGRVAFFDTDNANKTFTAERTEFIGRNGSLQNPAAMSRTKLSGRVGVGIDPCAAIQVTIELREEEDKEVVFRLGMGKDTSDARNIIRQSRGIDRAKAALDKVVNYWRHTVESLQIETPDKAVNLLANGWLTYQTLSCRLWGRSGYYQSGGAFGFRDQLQDVLALIHAKPQLARQHILLSASRQFDEGDVQHWWHPPVGRGVRTRCSDDYLWLPFVTCRYISKTSDTGILSESVPLLEGRLLNPDEESNYDHFNQSDRVAILYNHCVRSIKHGFRYGSHGLPLIGTGDWNDGMDRVGKHGKGESVWLAFFLYDILIQFIPLAQSHNDPDFAAQCTNEAKTLKENIEKNGWDGHWYRRAYFDDGTLLGSASNQECQIDSLTQSWSVLSRAGETVHAAEAMASADKRLVRPKDHLIQLLDPAFDKSAFEPGYIKGYVPGVRENGGQYTQAAIWLIMAFAKLGNSKKAWELLDMINPINHSKTADEVAVYKVEPYVIAADVYALSPHIGRGGWTWYTGSAGWTYQLITESLLGLKQETDKLILTPCIPPDWETFKVHYRFKNTLYHITFFQKSGVGEMRIKMNGAEQTGNAIDLMDDGAVHDVEVNIFSGESTETMKTT
jgi:cyclic beta-1,2-glucan synthetase